jgi:hypothetical protein
MTPRIPASTNTAHTSSPKKYMSVVVVTPARSCSTTASSVPSRTVSRFMWVFSAGQMWLSSHSLSGRSSAIPRSSVIARWEWVLTRPGMTMQLVALISSPVGARSSSSSAGPTAAIRPPAIATAPFAISSRPSSMVSTVPPSTIVSQFAALVMGSSSGSSPERRLYWTNPIASGTGTGTETGPGFRLRFQLRRDKSP